MYQKRTFFHEILIKFQLKIIAGFKHLSSIFTLFKPILSTLKTFQINIQNEPTEKDNSLFTINFGFYFIRILLFSEPKRRKRQF